MDRSGQRKKQLEIARIVADSGNTLIPPPVAVLRKTKFHVLAVNIMSTCIIWNLFFNTASSNDGTVPFKDMVCFCAVFIVPN